MPDQTIDSLKDEVYRHIIRVTREMPRSNYNLVESLLKAFATFQEQRNPEIGSWLELVASRVYARYRTHPELQAFFETLGPKEEPPIFDMVSCVQSALDAVTTPLHSVYAARDLEELDWDTAARELKSTAAAIRAKMPLARKRIREEMDARLAGA